MEHRHGHLIGRLTALLLATTPAAIALAQSAQSSAQEPVPVPAPVDIAAGFRDPPASARPRVWWHWMNGNITKDGIRKDLDWMRRIGIGGVQHFDAALETPQIVDKRLIYMTPPWKDAFRFAVAEADKAGLEFTVAASPGWSETGGPWVPPQDGMKKLVWSETVAGTDTPGMPGPLTLPLPPSVTGPYQDMPRTPNMAANTAGRPDPTYYHDVAVLAYPLPRGADGPAVARFATAAGNMRDASSVTDGRYAASIPVPADAKTGEGIVTVDFPAPREVRSLTLALAGATGGFGRSSVRARLDVENGAGWRRISDVPLDGGLPSTVAFAPVTAKRFRVVIVKGPEFSLGMLGGVPGAANWNFPQPPAAQGFSLAELRLSGEDRVDHAEGKAGYVVLGDYAALTTTAAPGTRGVAPATVVDLTAKLRRDGTLDWTPPAGRWRIVRLGYSLLGTTNHPAPPEATGLEVDKYDAAAVRRYLDTYIGNLRDAAGPGMIGTRGISALLTDSIEVGPSNWTADMVGQFRRLRGYDPTPWLPVLTGTIVGSRLETDRFLFDYRATLADLIASEHYGQLASTAHAAGLKVYGEALEDGRPVFGSELAMRRHADVPMAALWTYDPARGPRQGLLGDMKGAASVAHVYGQNLVAAESLTAAFSPWAFGPADLKPAMDLELAYGINRPVIHTSVHQPADDRLPGLSLGPFGQYFNRHETWAEMARPWVDYMARSAYLLQQGRYFADVAYFYGEDTPLTLLYANGVPADAPTRYGYDPVDRDMILNAFDVDGGDIVSGSGARYRILYLGGTSARMTMPVLRRLAALAEAGATIVGKPPLRSPGLSDSDAGFRVLVARLWSGKSITRIGKGRVVASDKVEAALATIGVEADTTAPIGSDILFLHRRLSDGDIYFVNNRAGSAMRGDIRLRTTGRSVELWRADTGQMKPVSYHTDRSATVVPLDLAAHDAVFLVLRKTTVARSAVLTTPVLKPLAVLDQSWDVSFQAGRGAPAGIRLETLAPLENNAEPGIRYFSGIATYTRSFDISRLPHGSLWLDLGKVGEVAEVRVNGVQVGTVWKPPYRLDVSSAIHRGMNRIEVRVANLWVNRLIGDAQPGAAKVTWTAGPTYEPNAPLRASGLIGPVQLLTGP